MDLVVVIRGYDLSCSIEQVDIEALAVLNTKSLLKLVDFDFSSGLRLFDDLNLRLCFIHPLKLIN